MADTINSAAQAVQAAQEANTAQTVAETAPSKPAVNYEELMAKKERQWRAKERELQAKLAKFESNYVPKEQLSGYIPKQKLSEDPISVLTEAGLSAEQISQYLLTSGQPKDPVIMQLQSQIRQLTERLENTSKQSEQAAAQQYEATKKQLNADIRRLADSDERFETVKAYGAYDAVVELIEQKFEQEGYVMDTDEALEAVENYLLEEAQKALQLKKIQAKLSQQQQTEAPVSAPVKSQQSQEIKTLSNKMPSAPSSRTSEKERKERAMAAFYGKLNK